MALSVTFSVLLLIFATYSTNASEKTENSNAENALPKGMHQDMYCIGCEMTMKVVDRVLRHASREQLDVVVPKTLRDVCKPDHFDISEYSKDTVHDACKHIIKKHGKEMKEVLITHYSKKKRPSYLDMVQRICLNLTDACHGVMHNDHDHDPMNDDARLKLDPETNEFVVLPGKNLKVAKPVSQVHEEL